MFAARQWDLQLAIEQDVIAEIERPSAVNYRGCNGQNISGYIADGGADLGIISDFFHAVRL
jgi:ATP phosphoribosyltransferase